MANTRVLVEDQGNVKLYNIVNEEGIVVGQEREQMFSTEEVNRLSILNKANQALADNVAFLALTPPTAAQIAAQVKALTRQNNALIRLVLNRMDSAD